MRDVLAVAVHVQHDNVLLDRHGRRMLVRDVRAHVQRPALRRQIRERLVRPLRGGAVRRCRRLLCGGDGVDLRVRVDDGTASLGVLDVFDTDGDLFANDLRGRSRVSVSE